MPQFFFVANALEAPIVIKNTIMEEVEHFNWIIDKILLIEESGSDDEK